MEGKNLQAAHVSAGYGARFQKVAQTRQEDSRRGLTAATSIKHLATSHGTASHER